MFGWFTLLLAAVYLLAASPAWWWWLVWLVAAVGWREHRKERRRQKAEGSRAGRDEHGGRDAFRRLVNRRPRRADVEERDAWEGSFWDAPDPKSVDATLEIRYRDADGNRTSRVVDVRRFDNILYGGVSGGEVNPQELRECCHAIVATQNAVHPSEQAGLDYIDRRCPSYPAA